MSVTEAQLADWGNITADTDVDDLLERVPALIAEVRRLRAERDTAVKERQDASASAEEDLAQVTRERDAFRERRDAMWAALIGIVSVLEGEAPDYSLKELDYARATEWDWWPKRLEEEQRRRLRDIWAVYVVKRTKLDEVKS